MSNDPIDSSSVDELRAVVHQHIAMLTAAGHSPLRALMLAAHCAVLVHSDRLEDALRSARLAIEKEVPSPSEMNAS